MIDEEAEVEAMTGIITVDTEVQAVIDIVENIIQGVVADPEVVQDLVIENLVLFLFQHQVEQ